MSINLIHFGTECETSSDFDLLVDLIAHVLADKETSVVRVAHHQAVARQRQKLVADFGVTMHIAWARHMLDNREFVIGGGTQPSTGPVLVGSMAWRRRRSVIVTTGTPTRWENGWMTPPALPPTGKQSPFREAGREISPVSGLSVWY